LMALFQELEFKPWVKELEGEGVALVEQSGPASDVDEELPAVPEHTRYGLIEDVEQLEALVRRLRQAGCFAFGLDSDGQHFMEARIIGLSFASTPGEADYLPLGHD